MCGIAGLFTYNFPNDDVDYKVKAVIQRMLLSESLVYMEPRGRDSTGMALLWDDKQTAILKQPIPVSDWARDDGLWDDEYCNPDDELAHFDWLMKQWMRDVDNTQIMQALGHVRKRTVGSEYNMHNNHPIIIRPDGVDQKSIGDGTDLLIGVHNGGINNADSLFTKHKFNRIGQVDSEVIFQLMHKYKDDISEENLSDTFNQLTGVFATMAYNPQIPNIVGCMRDVRPLDGAYIKELGSLMLISERKFLDAALENYDRWRVREANSIYTLLDYEGNEHDLGKVGDVFPYLNCDFYTTLPTGVFVLDLEKEVTEKTVARDLIKVKNVTKPAVSNTTKKTDNRSAAGCGTGSCIGNKAKPKAPSKPEVRKESDAGQLVDLSRYDADAEAADDKDVEIDPNVDTQTGDFDESDGASKEIIDDGCPYSWDERIKWALEALYQADAANDSRLLITRLNEVNMKDILGRFLIDVEDENKAKTDFASYHDAIFPQGFALGVQHGYNLAGDEYDSTIQEEDDKEEEMRNRLSDLEKSNKNKDKAVRNIAKKCQEIEKKRKKEEEDKQKYQAQLIAYGPIYRMYLRERGVIGPDNRPDRKKLKELQQEATEYNKQITIKIAEKMKESDLTKN